MLVYLGNIALILSLMLSVVNIIFCFCQVTKYIKKINYSILLFIVTAFITLVYGYVISDYTIYNVWLNSHQLKPLLYKIGGSWGNHEGSMLLIILIQHSYLCGLLVKNEFKAKELKLISLIGNWILVFSLLYLILTSNPFVYNPMPVDANGLNPLLQDIALIIHPPLLYLGYMGNIAIYVLALCILIKSECDFYLLGIISNINKIVWLFLTAGIILGAWWAYRELGWGGYWFWDPVENISLMPWLVSTSLLHLSKITNKHHNYIKWTLFHAIIGFNLSIFGTFLVRSGIITSVHSFASDPSRGILILAFLVISMIISLYYFIRFNSSFQKNIPIGSRAKAILLNDSILIYMLLIIVLGTIVPVINNILFNQNIIIDHQFYNKLILPFFIIISFIIGVFLVKVRAFLHLLFLFVSIGISYFIVMFFGGYPGILMQLYIISGIYLMLISLWQFFKKKISLEAFLAHFALGMLIAIITINNHYNIDIQHYIKLGEEIQIKNVKIKFSKLKYDKGKNYITRIAELKILVNEKLFYLYPESRFYPVEKNVTAESDIKTYNLIDYYAIIGEINEKNYLNLRFYIKPLTSLIWLGGGLLLISMVLRLKLLYLRHFLLDNT